MNASGSENGHRAFFQRPSNTGLDYGCRAGSNSYSDPAILFSPRS